MRASFRRAFLVATWPEARKTWPAWCIPDFGKSCFLRFSAWRFLRFSVCAVFRHLLCLLFGGGGVGGGGLNDVLFRGQAYAASIKSTTRGKEHATNETTAGGGRGAGTRSLPLQGQPTSGSPSNHHHANLISPCKHHHQETITMQTSTPSSHHHANIITKQPSP